ncbi:hypothetical protein CRG98_028518 [Punica granatum]|uniref:Uncharacterized protein n=1 Tax=Punica granatum TaxID=22663 RepID=A0A2I0J4D8_PUNGR|nr:hypothetical protein CRG98_028518 [Punica granatum]
MVMLSPELRDGTVKSRVEPLVGHGLAQFLLNRPDWKTTDLIGGFLPDWSTQKELAGSKVVVVVTRVTEPLVNPYTVRKEKTVGWATRLEQLWNASVVAAVKASLGGFWMHVWWLTIAKGPLEAKTNWFAWELSTLGHPWDVCESGWWVVVAPSDPQNLKKLGEATDTRRSTPFLPTGSRHEDSRSKLGLLFMTRQLEANARTWEHGLQKGNAFLTRLPGRPIHERANDTRRKAYTSPKTTRTMKQDSDCVSKFILVSRVDPDSGKKALFFRKT